eukprot:1158967-Pelagomonas_calceolata.AAC.7
MCAWLFQRALLVILECVLGCSGMCAAGRTGVCDWLCWHVCLAVPVCVLGHTGVCDYLRKQ